jgi:hypothetical protein
MSEQATVQAPSNGNAAPAAPQLAERKYGGADSMRRVKQLLSELFGPSPAKWIQGLLDLRKNVLPSVNGNWRELERKLQTETKQREALEAELRSVPHGDAELKAAYQRGRADLQAEIVFAERLAEIQARYPDFDRAWASVRPLVPRVVWEEAAELEHGLEGAYQISKLPELAAELAELPPEKARERFRFFVRDLTALTKGIAR